MIHTRNVISPLIFVLVPPQILETFQFSSLQIRITMCILVNFVQFRSPQNRTLEQECSAPYDIHSLCSILLKTMQFLITNSNAMSSYPAILIRLQFLVFENMTHTCDVNYHLLDIASLSMQ